MSHPTDHELEDVRRDAATVDEAPTPTSEQRVIRRLADLGDWLNRETVLRALEDDGGAAGSNTRQ
jgi:hypothetical protein